jgi:N utilization substance protein A
MAALVAPGAPVSVLIDYGLSEAVVEALVGAGIGTIERLGGMTPEQLQEIGLGEDHINEVGAAVNAYYSQFEEPQAEPTPQSADLSASAEEAAEVQGTDAASLDTEPGPAGMPELMTETNYPPGTLYDPDSAEERFEPGSVGEIEESEIREGVEQFGTMEDAGSPTENPSEGEVPEDDAPEERAEPDEDQSGRG